MCVAFSLSISHFYLFFSVYYFWRRVGFEGGLLFIALYGNATFIRYLILNMSTKNPTTQNLECPVKMPRAVFELTIWPAEGGRQGHAIGPVTLFCRAATSPMGVFI